MTNIVPLASKRPDVDPELVEMCERLLRWANEGKLAGLAYATVSFDGTIGSAYHTAEGHKQGNLLLASSSQLNHRINAAIYDQPDAAGFDEE